MGHCTADRYEISQEGSERIQQAFNNIRNHRAVYAIDWGDGYDVRLAYTSSFFSEFIAEFHLIYFVDGTGLRHHIEQIEDPDVQEAYRFIYNEIKDRVFSGREY